VNNTFIHKQWAHCENGMTSNLLSSAGLPISEALSFGIGGGLFYGYFPFIKMGDLPLMTFRSMPGTIFKHTIKRLGGQYKTATYRNAKEAEAGLDDMIAAGIPVGMQVGLHWLPYVPEILRMHFNSHHVVAFGKEGDEYLISDSNMPVVVRCNAKDIGRARFAPGSMTPRGRAYWLARVPTDVDWPRAIIPAIRSVCSFMIKYPVPIIGVRGIRFTASRLTKWPQRLGQRRAILHLGQMVRSQEEYGTGGAGFRYIYAAFLQEAGNMLKKPALIELSRELTEIGDQWREFAVLASRICKGRSKNSNPYGEASEALLKIAGREERFYQNLWETSQ
jgi:hypothetical protein